MLCCIGLPQAQAQTTSIPQWLHGNLNTNDGRFRLQWQLPADAEYVRIRESGPLGAHSWFAYRSSESFVKNQPGTYTYDLQACTGRIDSATQCAAGSSSIISVTVGATVRSFHEQMPATDEAAVQALNGQLTCAQEDQLTGGPNQFVPGAWWNPCQPGHGWAFYWVNSLRFPEGTDLHRNVYQLIGVWASYRYFNGAYRPVWMFLPLRNIGPSLYEGAVVYQTLANNGSCAMGELIGSSPAKCQLTAGTVRLNFNGSGGGNSNRDGVITWHMNMPGFPAVSSVSQAIEPLSDLIADSAAPENHRDFASGWWWNYNGSSLDESYAYMLQLRKNLELDHVIFFDDQGQPIWLNAGRNDLDPSNSINASFNSSQITYNSRGYAPGLLARSTTQVSLATAQMSRTINPVRIGHNRDALFSINLQIDHDGRRASLTRNNVVTKVVNFFDVDYVLSGTDTASTICEVQPSEQCQFHINWFRDDDFPEATIWRRDLNSNQLAFVATLSQPANAAYAQSLPLGRYQYEMYRNATSTSPLLAKSRALEITMGAQTVDLPPTPLSDPALPEDTASTRVGATEGSFQVNAVGAATYTIPLRAAQGSGGLAPAVSLNYNSQGGNGLMGLGWGLNAYSLISRCAQTFEQDRVPGDDSFTPNGVQLTAEDRFCMDGQRLMLVAGSYGANGAVYRKEQDDFTRVTSYANNGQGPTCFIAELASGAKNYYGNCAAATNPRALFLADLTSGVPYAWAQARMQDLAGNYIDYDYAIPSGGIEILLTQIRYTGNTKRNQTPYATMSFVYQTKPASEQTSAYVAGKRIISQRRLVEIHSQSGSEYLRSYYLNYLAANDGVGRSLLDNVQECSRPISQGGLCFDRTRFSWNRGDHRLNSTNLSAGTVLTGFEPRIDAGPNGLQILDVNADGKADLFYEADDGFYTAISNGTGFNVQPLTAASDVREMNMMDLNADGFVDVIYISDVDNHWYVRLWNGDQFASPQRIDLAWSAGTQNSLYSEPVVADFNGDGLADIVSASGSAADSFLVLIRNQYGDTRDISRALAEPQYVAVDVNSNQVTNAEGTWIPSDSLRIEFRKEDVLVVDRDADGRMELYVTISQAHCMNDPGDPASCTPLPDQNTDGTSYYEVVTDPKSKLEEPIDNKSNNGELVVWARFRLIDNAEDPLFVASRVGYAVGCSGACGVGPLISKPLVVDVNGDGLLDELIHENYEEHSERRLRIFSGLSTASITVLSTPDDDRHFQLADIDGDGSADVLSASGESAIDRWQMYRWSWQGAGNGGFAAIPTALNAIAGNVFTSGDGDRPEDSDQSYFADFNGDGITDHLLLRKTGSTWSVYPSTGYNTVGSNAPSFVMTEIDNGLGDADGDGSDDADGAKIKIAYTSLSDPQVYQRENNSIQAWYGSGRTPVYDMISTLPVVRQVRRSSPAWDVANGDLTGTATALNNWERLESYFYRGAKMQGGGRGFLGFRQVYRLNEEDRMLNISMMRQDFPYTGRLYRQEVWQVPAGQNPWSISAPASRADQPCWAGVSCAPAIPPAEPCISTSGYGDPCTVSITPIDPGTVNGGSPATNGLLGPTGPDPTPIQAGAVRVMLMAMNWEQRRPISANPGVTFTYPQLSLEEKADLDGSLMGRTVRVQYFDEPDNAFYGQLSRQVEFNYNEDDGEGNWVRQLDQRYSYTPIPGNTWVLGRVSRDDQINRRTGTPVLTRSSTYGYHPSTYLMSYQQNSSIDDNMTRRSDFLRDDFGNLTQETLSGTGVSPSRVRKMDYDARGRWIDKEWVQVANDSGTNQFELLSEVINRDRFGNPLSSRNQQGLTTTFRYDAMGRLQTRWDATGAWQRIRLSAGAGSLCPQSTAYRMTSDSLVPSGPYAGRAAAPASVSCVDALGRNLRTLTEGQQSGQWIYQDSQYDISGRTLAQSIPLFTAPSATNADLWTRSAYDELGRAVLQRLPDGARTTTYYAGLETTVVNARGNATVSLSNVLGEVVQMTDALQGVTTYRYDAVGNQTQIDGPLAGTLDQVVLAYDSLDNRTLLSDPDKGVREYAYNALGEELCALDERQMAVQQIYDGAGRVIRQRDLRNVASVQNCSGTVDKEAAWRYGHDASQRQNFGALLSESDNFVERLFSYDALGRQVSMRTRFLTRGSTSFLQSSTYDEFGRVYQRFDGGPNQSGLRYVYNERGYQTALREADDPSVVYQQIIQRDAFGNISAELLGNGLTTTRVYDRRGYLRQLQTLGAGLRVQDLQMTYDPVGNLTERHDYKSASSAGYQHEVIRYDALNRLLWVDLQLGSAAPVRTMSMNYDAGGRILSKEGVGYAYDTALPVHAVKSRGGQSYFYDVNGNQTQRDGTGERRTMTYTHFDKPARVWMGDHREESRYTYSPQRGRLERESWRSGVLQERYWFLGSLDVVVTNPSATNPSEIRYEYRRQIDGIAQVQIENGNETLKYFHYDHLGSVTAISDASPNINNIQYSDYDAFGRRRHAQLWQLPITTNILNNVTEYGFGGHESRDELGLVHMNGRTYDPDVGQMMQADAVVQSPMDGQNYNRYAYVFNNPLSYTDPTGYEADGATTRLDNVTVYAPRDPIDLGRLVDLLPSNAVIFNRLNHSFGQLIASGTATGAFGNGFVPATSEFFDVNVLYASNEDDLEDFFNRIKNVRGLILVKDAIDNLTVEEFNILFGDYAQIGEQDEIGLFLAKEALKLEITSTALPLLRQAAQSGNKHVLKEQMKAALTAGLVEGGALKSMLGVITSVHVADATSAIIGSYIKISKIADVADLPLNDLSAIAAHLKRNLSDNP